MISTEVRFDSGGMTLAGTLSVPAIAGPYPCVVMVHGSGPQDRNGNIGGLRTEILRTLAHGLAEHGIASLRYDKRGCGTSGGRFHAAGLSDFVADAGAAIDHVCRSLGADLSCVHLLGHSEGAVLAPEIAIHAARVAGVIMLCPSLRSFEEDYLRNAAVLNRDLARIPGLKGVLARWLFHSRNPAAEIRSLRKRIFDTRRETVWISFSRVGVKFYRETFNYDVRQHLSCLHKPILAIGGGKDFQCLAEDASQIAGIACGPVETAIVADMNHMLRLQPDEPSILAYRKQSAEPVARQVGSLVTEWIRRMSTGEPLR